jgi:hypothetical protein
MESSKDQFENIRMQEIFESQASIFRKKPANTENSKTPVTTIAPINTNKLIDLNSGSIRDFAMGMVDYYTDGYNSPTEGLILSKKLSEISDLLKENLQDPAVNELKLGKGEKVTKFGCTINVQMVGVRYSYKECNDPIWNELNEKIKEREKFLQGIKGSISVNIEETGEVVTIYEPIKSGKEAPIIKVL